MFVIVWKVALAAAALLIAVHYAAESFKTAKEAYHLSTVEKKTDRPVEKSTDKQIGGPFVPRSSSDALPEVFGQ